MKNYRTFLLLAPFLLAGCAAPVIGALNSSFGAAGAAGAMGQPPDIAEQSAQATAAATALAPPADRKTLDSTPLPDALRQNAPAKKGRAPEWPKVVIVNLQVPDDQLIPTRGLPLKANDCIQFDAVFWRDAKHSERFTDLSLCAPDLPDQPNDFVLDWKNAPVSGKTTGKTRGDGPTPPHDKLPNDPDIDRWLKNEFGVEYLGGLLTLLGYDPGSTADSRRFWVKNMDGN